MNAHIVNGIVTPNSIRLDGDTVFYAVGIAFQGYPQGVWMVRFTPRLDNARAFAEVEMQKRNWDGGTSGRRMAIWECHLRDGKLVWSDPPSQDGEPMRLMRPGESLL